MIGDAPANTRKDPDSPEEALSQGKGGTGLPHVYERVRHFLVRRHKVPSRGTTRFSAGTVFGDLGVLRLRRVHLGPPPCASG